MIINRTNVVALIAMLLAYSAVFSQETTITQNFKHVKIDATGNVPYSKALILLHPIYNGTDIADNYIVGNLTARRGGVTSYNRLNSVFLNTSSSYRSTTGMLASNDDNVEHWRLKTCIFNGVKYLAVDIPYMPGQHASGFKFAGWITSSAESLKFIIYDINGAAQNTAVLTDIQDFVSNMSATHQVKNFNVMGKVGIGTTEPSEELSVNGKIRAHEIKVEVADWPDYVFEDSYQLPSLAETERYIKNNKHLPDMPSADQVQADGVAVGELNRLLLQKVEELTLHLIEKSKRIDILESELLTIKEKISN